MIARCLIDTNLIYSNNIYLSRLQDISTVERLDCFIFLLVCHVFEFDILGYILYKLLQVYLKYRIKCLRNSLSNQLF